MSEYWTHPSSHPEWNTIENLDGPLFGLPYECADCTWIGRGADAYDHHRERHHEIWLTGSQAPIEFSCCKKNSQRKVG